MNLLNLDSEISSARGELCDVLTNIAAVSKLRPQKRFPTRWCDYLFDVLDEASSQNSTEVSSKTGHAIRQVHDFYGWMAKSGTNGLCAGALYRSASFMKLTKAERNGSKGSQKNIHIEHLVPVRVLRLHLMLARKELPSASALHETLMGISICVAMTQDEANALNRTGVAKDSSSAFDARGSQIDERPFRRYLPAFQSARESFKLFNIVSGTEIDLENFSFADHRMTLKRASNLCTSDAADCSLYSLDLFCQVRAA